MDIVVGWPVEKERAGLLGSKHTGENVVLDIRDREIGDVPIVFIES